MNEPDIRASIRERDRARKAAWRAKNRERTRETDKLAKRRARALLRKEATPAKTTAAAQSVSVRRLAARELLRIALAL